MNNWIGFNQLDLAYLNSSIAIIDLLKQRIEMFSDKRDLIWLFAALFHDKHKVITKLRSN